MWRISDKWPILHFLSYTSVEFQLLDKTEHKIAETSADMTSYQSPHISMARVDFLKDITDVISGLGWKPYQVG